MSVIPYDHEPCSLELYEADPGLYLARRIEPLKPLSYEQWCYEDGPEPFGRSVFVISQAEVDRHNAALRTHHAAKQLKAI